MLNEVHSDPFKRVIQSLSYLPHFISWIVVSYILYTFLQMDTGPMNMLLKSLGFDQVNFMGTPKYFRPIVIISAIWKEIGWGTIIYLAALSAIDPQLYEAAMLDGAGRFQQDLFHQHPRHRPDHQHPPHPLAARAAHGGLRADLPAREPDQPRACPTCWTCT